MRSFTIRLLCAAALLSATHAPAEEALIAVAASILPPIEAASAAVEAETGHRLTLVSGSTGALYAQIVNGAPFDALVAADAERPRLLEDGGHGAPGTRVTVARGRLVLYSRDAALIEARGIDALREPSLRRVAIANPRLAPYGVAARQTLDALGLWPALRARIVRGESVAQAYAMVATGNAELGLVALAQALAGPQGGAHVAVPERLYAPILHDMIILERARANAAASALQAYLRSGHGRAVLARFGYATGD